MPLAELQSARLAAGRGDDIGRLKAGLCADINVFKLTGTEFGGALNDSLGGFLMSGVSARALATIINGRVVQPLTFDELEVAETTTRASAALLRRAEFAAGG